MSELLPEMYCIIVNDEMYHAGTIEQLNKHVESKKISDPNIITIHEYCETHNVEWYDEKLPDSHYSLTNSGNILYDFNPLSASNAREIIQHRANVAQGSVRNHKIFSLISKQVHLKKFYLVYEEYIPKIILQALDELGYKVENCSTKGNIVYEISWEA